MLKTIESAPPADKEIAVHKSVLSLVLFSLIALLLIAPFLHINLSSLVLLIMSLGCLFTALRAANILRLAYQVSRNVRKYFSAGKKPELIALQWRHVIVVPIYKESAETIERTIRHLARHRSAANHFVVLCAHETADAGHDEKFRYIHDAWADQFLGMVKSVHSLDAHECPGKAANVNHAVRSYAALQEEQSFANTIVTVIDCDTQINEFYFYELERQAATVADPHCVIFAAPTFFENNRHEVPCFVRAMDDLWSLAAAANIFSNSKLGFPISNYSLTLQMIREMGYWDVDHDSVGEDFHMFIKATVKLDDDVRLVPIGIPMNNENVIGHNYGQSLLARYSQAMRHALGISSTAYLLKHMLASKFSLRKCVVMLLCLESHCFPLLYFVTGLHLIECAVVGDFFTFFQGEKLRMLQFLIVAGFVFGMACFTSYKVVQAVVRHRIFNQPRHLVKNLLADVCDMCVQGSCAFAFFIVPFGYRAYQNLLFKTNKVYYSKIEESARKH